MPPGSSVVGPFLEMGPLWLPLLPKQLYKVLTWFIQTCFLLLYCSSVLQSFAHGLFEMVVA